MKIRFSRKNFIDSLSIGGSMSGKSKTLPILDMSKITIKDKKATISSFDGEVAITMRSDIIDNEGDIMFCINTKDLLSILKSLKDDEIELNIDNNLCLIVHSKGKMEIPISEGDDFPTPSKDDNEREVVLSSDILIDWVKKAKNFIEQNDIRPIMGGMYLYADGTQVGCAATNAHKLYCDYVDMTNNGDTTTNAVLTIKALDSLVGMISNSENVSILFSENNIAFKTSNAKLMCRKIDGRYPAFKTIIPKSSNINVEVDIEDLKDAINRAILMSGMSHLLKIKCEGINMHIESCDFDFGKKSNEDVTCSVDGGEITFGVNGVFLLDCINSIDSNKAMISLIDASKAIILKEDTKTILLMPMKLA